MDDGDADGFQLSRVEDFSGVEIVNVAVGDEIEIGAANCAGSWEAREGRAIFEDGGFSDAKPVFRKFECGDARGADSVLYGDERTVVPERPSAPARVESGPGITSAVARD